MTAELRRMDDERFDRLEKKVDDILERVLQLPCSSSSKEREGMKIEIGWLQKGAVGIICALFGIGVWVGMMNTTVATNTSKWTKLEPEHQSIIKDVEILKEKSYGYRNAKVASDGEKI